MSWFFKSICHIRFDSIDYIMIEKIIKFILAFNSLYWFLHLYILFTPFHFYRSYPVRFYRPYSVWKDNTIYLGIYVFPLYLRFYLRIYSVIFIFVFLYLSYSFDSIDPILFEKRIQFILIFKFLNSYWSFTSSCLISYDSVDPIMQWKIIQFILVFTSSFCNYNFIVYLDLKLLFTSLYLYLVFSYLSVIFSSILWNLLCLTSLYNLSGHLHLYLGIYIFILD